MLVKSYYPELKAVEDAACKLVPVVQESPLSLNINASMEHSAQVYLKREDLQVVRSYKIRGAYHKMVTLSKKELRQGVVCASAGNHAQGVAFSCSKLGAIGYVFMPTPTPKQKIEQVKMFGGSCVKIELVGDTFDEAQFAAREFCVKNKMTFVPPFDDKKIIEGQATIALELLRQSRKPIDYLFLPVGGGGLAAGVSSIFKSLSPNTKVIGVEPSGAPSMSKAISENNIVKLSQIDKFVDGAAVQKVGALNFAICKDTLDEMVVVSEGKVCETILKLYNKDAIVVEPAGALALSALDRYQDEIEGKEVVCLVSGSNNDIVRMEEIKERALLYQGLKHYFIVNFPQRSGALKEFVTDVLAPTDNITFFEFSQRNNRENGPAVIGVQLEDRNHLGDLLKRMSEKGLRPQHINDKPELMNLLVG
jgi:threonine dehydratase